MAKFEYLVVDFQHLNLVVPIRLQDKIMCTHDSISTWQNVVNSMNLCVSNFTSKVHEKQLSDVCVGGGGGEDRPKESEVGLRYQIAHTVL